MTEENDEIVWNEKERKFETKNKRAYIEYELRGKNCQVVDVNHKYVPLSKRGQCIASHLCVAVFSHAQNHFSIIPTCSYVSEIFLPRNPTCNAVLYKEDVKS